MSSPSDGILLIKNGTLIDGTSGTPRPNGRIVIRSGTIARRFTGNCGIAWSQ